MQLWPGQDDVFRPSEGGVDIASSSYIAAGSPDPEALKQGDTKGVTGHIRNTPKNTHCSIRQDDRKIGQGPEIGKIRKTDPKTNLFKVFIADFRSWGRDLSIPKGIFRI